MAYATQQNLVDRFGEGELLDLTDRDNQGEVDVDAVATALTDATDTIDSYLSSRYTLPLDPTPGIVARVCSDIARYYLYEDRVTEQVAERYKAAIAWLRDIQAGKANLDADPAGLTPSTSSAPVVDAPDRVFTTETLKDY